MSRRSPFLPLLALSVCALAVWLYFTPYFAVRKLQAAAESGDQKALAAMVDFPALRASLKDEVRADAAKAVSGERESAVARIGGLVAGTLAGAVAEPVVNSLVTPGGVSLLVQGRRPGEKRRTEGRSWREEVEIDREYDGPNRFLVRYRDRESGAQRMALVLTRQGLQWRLTGAELGAGR
jgi:hypothetical protein